MSLLKVTSVALLAALSVNASVEYFAIEEGGVCYPPKVTVTKTLIKTTIVKGNTQTVAYIPDEEWLHAHPVTSKDDTKSWPWDGYAAKASSAVAGWVKPAKLSLGAHASGKAGHGGFGPGDAPHKDDWYGQHSGQPETTNGDKAYGHSQVASDVNIQGICLSDYIAGNHHPTGSKSPAYAPLKSSTAHAYSGVYSQESPAPSFAQPEHASSSGHIEHVPSSAHSGHVPSSHFSHWANVSTSASPILSCSSEIVESSIALASSSLASSSSLPLVSSSSATSSSSSVVESSSSSSAGTSSSPSSLSSVLSSSSVFSSDISTVSSSAVSSLVPSTSSAIASSTSSAAPPPPPKTCPAPFTDNSCLIFPDTQRSYHITCDRCFSSVGVPGGETLGKCAALCTAAANCNAFSFLVNNQLCLLSTGTGFIDPDVQYVGCTGGAARVGLCTTG